MINRHGLLIRDYMDYEWGPLCPPLGLLSHTNFDSSSYDGITQPIRVHFSQLISQRKAKKLSGGSGVVCK